MWDSRRNVCKLSEVPAVETGVAAARGEIEVNMAVKLELQGVRVVFWDVFDFTIVLYGLD